MKKIFVLMLFFILGCAHAKPATQQAVEEPGKVESNVKVKIETNQGTMVAELYDKEVPKTVDNFVQLAKKGFYDGKIGRAHV